jgi:glycosyltransferase involved in cell wall biosynthesis
VRVCFVVSDLTYPPVEGLHEQTVTLIDGLRKAGVDLVVTGYCRDLTKFDHESFTAKTGINARLFGLPESTSSLREGLRQAFSTTESGLGRFIRETASDVIHLEGASAAGLRRAWMRNAVVSFVDPGSRRQWRLCRQATSVPAKVKHAVAAWGYLALETRQNRRGAVWHVVSAVDADHLRKRYRRAAIVSIPVIVPPAISAPSPDAAPRDRLRILVYGDLRQPHMAAGFLQIAHDALTRPDVVRACDVTVLGRVHESRLRNQLPPQFRASFIEWATDPASVLERSDIVLLPDPVGTGLKNRAVQALAAGKLLIAMPAGVEGIPVRHNVHALVADTPRHVGVLLGQAMARPDIIPRLGSAGRELVRQHFDSNVVVDRWLRLYGRLPSHTARS